MQLERFYQTWFLSSSKHKLLDFLNTWFGVICGCLTIQGKHHSSTSFDRFFDYWCRAREALRACLPDALKDNTFQGLLRVCVNTHRCNITQRLTQATGRYGHETVSNNTTEQPQRSITFVFLVGSLFSFFHQPPLRNVVHDPLALSHPPPVGQPPHGHASLALIKTSINILYTNIPEVLFYNILSIWPLSSSSLLCFPNTQEFKPIINYATNVRKKEKYPGFTQRERFERLNSLAYSWFIPFPIFRASDFPLTFLIV